MTTLSAIEASKDLGKILARALNGEDIRIECNGKVVALRPVEQLEDATAEYGFTADEVERSFQSISSVVADEMREGSLKKLA
jgi:hypothetical protein